MSNIEATLEYHCGHIVTNVQSFRGVQYKGQRPAYITLQPTVDEEHFIFSWSIKEFIYNYAATALDASSPVRGRLICKPYWFHKLVYTKDKG